VAEQSLTQSNHDLYNFQRGAKLDKTNYAVFLPAISTFYNNTISKQIATGTYVDKNRMPATLPNDASSLNFLDPHKSTFFYPWSLYSAGHADLDLSKTGGKEIMIRDRSRSDTWMLGDSGGFQIGKGKWEGDANKC
jgi:hypothetical protein